MAHFLPCHLSRLLVVGCAAGLSALACGGTTGMQGDGDTGGSGGSGEPASGGANGTGSASSGAAPSTGGQAPGTGGSTPGSGGEAACCLAEATCADGDAEIGSESDCPVGASCYSNHICCSTVWCAHTEEVQCDAYPSCPNGSKEATSCPLDTKCETVTLCGTTISCVYDSGVCDADPVCPEGSHQVDGCPGNGDCSRQTLCGTEIFCLTETPVSPCEVPEVDFNRNYLGGNSAQCSAIKFTCDAGTTPFQDKCGCGCEQPATCPEFVDCMPGSTATLDRLCSSNDCPYTLRAY